MFGLIVVYAWLFAGFDCCLWLLFGCCLGVCLVVVLGLLVWVWGLLLLIVGAYI